MIMAIDFKMILVADECEVSAERHDEVLDVLNNFLLYNFLVDIRSITLSDFLYIDEVQ